MTPHCKGIGVVEKRVRADPPLRAEVASAYGRNGHASSDPAILLKMMFLLSWDDIPIERKLMKIIPERLDYLWFLGCGLGDEIPAAQRHEKQELLDRAKVLDSPVFAGSASRMFV